MKVLFLDVDGVLNTIHSMSLLSLSRPRMTRLRKIIRDTDCQLVLSSTWRKHEDGLNKLRRAGLKFYGYTPDLAGTNRETGERLYRGHEIQAWLNKHPEVENYCIVDDDGDMLDSQLRNFVQTTMEHGLTEDHAYRITYILNHGPHFIS